MVFINNPLTNLAALCQPYQKHLIFCSWQNQISQNIALYFLMVLSIHWVNLLNVELGAAVTRLEGIAFEGVPKFEGIPEEEPLKTIYYESLPTQTRQTHLFSQYIFKCIYM